MADNITVPNFDTDALTREIEEKLRTTSSLGDTGSSDDEDADADEHFHDAEGEPLPVASDDSHNEYADSVNEVSGNLLGQNDSSDFLQSDSIQKSLSQRLSEPEDGLPEEGAVGNYPSEGFEETNDDGEDNEDEEIDVMDEEAELKKIELTLSEEEKEEKKVEAMEQKTWGNDLFKQGNFLKAKESYSAALKICPLCFAKERSILYSNRAACKMRMEDYDDAIKDSTKALEIHPHYVKCRLRRAELYEKVEKLDEALEDYKKVLEEDPSIMAAREACMRLPDQINERNEKMKEEMMGKLKDLGNMILKPFGLSTNNFKLNQDANSGGYSVQFVQGDNQQDGP